MTLFPNSGRFALGLNCRFYLWKKKYGQHGMTEVREMRQLREENARLKRLVADLTLDKHILGASPPVTAGGLPSGV